MCTCSSRSRFNWSLWRGSMTQEYLLLNLQSYVDLYIAMMILIAAVVLGILKSCLDRGKKTSNEQQHNNIQGA